MRMTWRITIWLGGSISALLTFSSFFFSFFLLFFLLFSSSFPFSNTHIPITFVLNYLLYRFGDVIIDVSDVMLI